MLPAITRPLTRLASVSHAVRRLSTAYIYPEKNASEIIIPKTDNSAAASPQAGFVSVKWLAAGIDKSDLAPSAADRSGSTTAGSEGVGVVTAVGSGVTVMEAGDRVVPIQMGLGTWCQQSHVSATDVIRIPSEVPTELAATLPGTPVTASVMLQRYCSDLKPGDLIVHVAADTAIGITLAQLARKHGLHIISIVDDSELHMNDYAPTIELLKLQGATVAIGQSYLASQGIKEVLSDLPAPKVVFKPADYSKDISPVTPSQSKVVTYGVPASSSKPDFALKPWLHDTERDVVEQTILDLTQLMQDGQLTGWLQRVPFNELPSAVEHGAQGHTRRKLVAMME